MTRDDLFTTIHKALRKGLFDVTVRAGATDWTDPVDVAAFRAQWQPLLDLLRSHAGHVDMYLMPLVEQRSAAVTAAIDEQHDDLDGLLDDLAERVAAACTAPDVGTGLEIYRDLARYVSSYLTHLHYEETVVMPAIWAACSDDEIAAARASLMADITPEERAYTMQLLLGSVDRRTRMALSG
jgi:hypothetical protein